MTPIVLGIDIGGTNTVFGIVDEHGACLADGTIPTRAQEPVEHFLPRLFDATEHLLEPFAATHALKSVGIGAPNANYYTGTVEHPPNLNWQGVTPLAASIRERFGVPTALTNDANAAALGEGLYGAARGMKNFMVITLGTGLGSGIVVNGDVLYGADGFAGELGHVTASGVQGASNLMLTGRQCGCGRRGCLETYVSATGICRTAFELVAELSTETVMASGVRAFTFETLSAAELARLAHSGDALANEAFKRTGTVLGVSMANAVAAFSPEAIIFFGGLANAGDLILRPTQAAFDAHVLTIFKGTTKLMFSALMSSNAAVLGASALAWKEVA
jgi:glucokinase